jgi:type IV secretory pathway protease TraF
MLGYALISPGKYSRRDALRLRAAAALQILGGAAVMLVAAGLVEAYVTPHAPLWVRLLVITLASLSLIWYFLRAGREPAGGAGSVAKPPETVASNTDFTY